MQIIAEPLTAEAFAPFGDVLEPPSTAGRTYISDALGNARDGAALSTSVAHILPTPPGPFAITYMERHEFSSQTFVPMALGRALVVVAPHDAQGKPDMDRMRAFVMTGGQSVTYRVNVWHHGMTVFDQPALFTIVMYLTGGEGDEEFVPVDRPITVTLPELIPA